MIKLIETESFAKYEYGDFFKFPRINRPHGYIINLKTEVDGVRWEIEVWFMTEKDRPNNELDLLLSNLTKNQVNKILKLKHDRKEKGLNKNNHSSIEIYKKVLIK